MTRIARIIAAAALACGIAYADTAPTCDENNRCPESTPCCSRTFSKGDLLAYQTANTAQSTVNAALVPTALAAAILSFPILSNPA